MVLTIFCKRGASLAQSFVMRLNVEILLDEHGVPPQALPDRFLDLLTERAAVEQSATMCGILTEQLKQDA